MDNPAAAGSIHFPSWEFRHEGGDWEPIEVPAPWQKKHPGFHGRGEYRTFLKRNDRAPLALHFEAVSRYAEIVVNGRPAGQHRGAWSPFRIDLSPFLFHDLSRRNEIVVRVDQERGHDTEGFLGEIGLLFGGIWGEVALISGETGESESPSPARPDIAVQGSRILHRGKPLLLRGVLHWGYYPEIGAPAPGEPQIRREIAWLRESGFNMVKFCLFVPPERYLDLCDEAGVWVWQEYPIWNRPLRGETLAAELEELLVRDSRHPSVIVRTFTCENHRVDPGLVRRLCTRARELAPGALVLGNSSWLYSEKGGDFFDEHPYLHNAEWRFYGERMRHALRDLSPSPLLLGETMAVDTWNDLGGTSPLYAESQRAIEKEVECDGLSDRSVRRALEVRKHQVETLRRELPGTGYVITVMRDIPACPLGFHGADGSPKFEAGDFVWHGDTMIVTDLEERSFFAASDLSVKIHLSHFGPQRLEGVVRCTFAGQSRLFPVVLEPGATEMAGEWTLSLPDVLQTRPFRLEAQLDDGDSSIAAANAWDVWAVPRSGTVPEEEGAGNRMVSSLTADDLSALESGATRLLLAGPRKGSWRCPTYTFWSPTLWIRPGLLPGTVERLVEELLLFDLLSGRVLEPAPLAESLVEVWDTHMEKGKVVRRPLVLETGVGRGRLIVSALRPDRPAGIALHRLLASRDSGVRPEGRRTGSGLAGDSVFPGPWEMSLDGRSWKRVQCDTALVNSGRNIFEGRARFRAPFVVPDAWQGCELILRCEAVGDSFITAIDSREVGRAGDQAGTWDGTRDIPREFRVRLDAGPHTLSFDVRDWRGGGGLVGPVLLTRTPDSLLY